MDDAILFSAEGPCATITLNRPQRGNALTPELQETFLRYLAQAAGDDLIHYVVLRAKGKYFCTGMDLSSSGSSLGGDSTDTYHKARAFFEALEQFPKPSERLSLHLLVIAS
jgi:enoyl-CoA hydratase/carnithine racemase